MVKEIEFVADNKFNSRCSSIIYTSKPSKVPANSALLCNTCLNPIVRHATTCCLYTCFNLSWMGGNTPLPTSFTYSGHTFTLAIDQTYPDSILFPPMSSLGTLGSPSYTCNSRNDRSQSAGFNKPFTQWILTHYPYGSPEPYTMLDITNLTVQWIAAGGVFSIVDNVHLQYKSVDFSCKGGGFYQTIAEYSPVDVAEPGTPLDYRSIWPTNLILTALDSCPSGCDNALHPGTGCGTYVQTVYPNYDH